VESEEEKKRPLAIVFAN